MAEAKLDKKIQKKVAPRAAFIKVVKNTLEDWNNIIYNDKKHERHYNELLSCQELIIAQIRKITVTQEEIIALLHKFEKLLLHKKRL